MSNFKQFKDNLIEFFNRVPNLQSQNLLYGIPDHLVSRMMKGESEYENIAIIVENGERWGWIKEIQKYALEIMIDNVRNFVKGTELDDELVEFENEFKLILSDNNKSVQYSNKTLTANRQIDLPVVIVAMTDAEAKNLIEGADNEVFNQFMKCYEEEDIVGWVNSYKKNRGEWNPYNNVSISEVISKVIKKYNKSGSNRIRPVFLSDEFFNNDHQINTWNWISKSGGIVIIDEISLFNQDVKETLRQAEIMSLDHISVIGITPISKKIDKAKGYIEEQLSNPFKRALGRFNNIEDFLCEFGVSRLKPIERLIFRNLEKLIKIKMNPYIQKLLQERYPEIKNTKEFLRFWSSIA